MATTGFDTYYGDTPVANLDQNQRQWYHPIVDRVFRERSVWTGMVPYVYDLAAARAKTMLISEVFGVHANFDPIGLRDLWLPASHIDSRSVQITFDRYAGKVAYDRYTPLITYWQQGGAAGRNAVEQILRGALGDHMVEVNDYLIRNAFLTGAYSNYQGGGASAFGSLTHTDIFDKEVVDDMWLGFSYRGLALAQNPDMPNSNQGTILCITTPGAVREMQRDSDWKTVMQYADPGRLLKYEQGSWHNCRFIVSPRMTLYNTGTKIKECTLDGAHSADAGSPDPSTTYVDGVRRVGQAGAQHYLQLHEDPTSGTAILVGDIVSIHVDRTSDFGVTNGADYRDGTKLDRRVVSVDGPNKRIALDRPLMLDTPTGAYVTKGTHVHSAVFVGGPGGVVSGVGQPIQMHAPPPVDDLEMMFRFSWDQYAGYNVFQPDVFETYYFTGDIKFKGVPVNQAAS